jgi:O-antigen ligase
MHALIYTVGAFILVGLVARNPMWGILVASAALPATQSYDSGIRGLNPFNILIFALVLGLYFRSSDPDAAPERAFPGRVPMGIFCFMVACAWVNGAFIQQIPPTADVRPFKSYDTFMMMKEELCLFLLMLLVFWSVRSAEEVKRAMNLVVLGMSAEVLFCMLEWARKKGRITGHLQTPNSLAAFSCVVAVTTGALFLATKGRIRWLYLLVSVGAGFACISTYSRGGLLALGVSILVLSLLRNRLVFVLLLVLSLSYRAWLPEVALARIDKAYTVDAAGGVEAADTAAQRLTIWKAGLAIIREHPYGIGLGTYPHFSGLYGTAEEMAHPDKNAHNEFVRIAAEMSLVGLAVFLWFLGSVFWAACRCYFKGKELGLGPVGYAGFAAVLGIVLASCFGTFFFQAMISGHFWMVGGLACRGYLLSKRERLESPAALSAAAPRIDGAVARA